MSEQIRIGTIDIETSPNLAHVWSLWDQNVSLSQLMVPSTVICFAWKWLGDRKVEFYSDHHDGHEEMMKQVGRLYDEADAVISYNGRSFDNKHLKREILMAGGLPPSPWADIDLFKVVKENFRFASSKLDHVAEQLGLGKKKETGGHETWTKCMAGDPAAWRKMRQYNIGDVRLTEALYWRLLPWIKGHPNVALWTGEDRACPNCGSTDIQFRGSIRTSASVFRRVHCQNCGKWSRTAKRTDTTELRGA